MSFDGILVSIDYVVENRVDYVLLAKHVTFLKERVILYCKCIVEI